MIDNLYETNFNLFAATHYDNPSCLDSSEFDDDLKRIKYLKRLFRKYEQTGVLRERLILNHLTVLYNVFYHEAMTKMLCYRLEDHMEQLKPFLIYLSYWPAAIYINEDKIIYDSNVEMDQHVVDTLRKV